MSEARSTDRRGEWWASAWITAVLAVSAAATLGFWLVLALGQEDTEALESPLMLSVARQLVVGPWELYGPFGGQNPLVLIHAPLYYRLAGLVAWPMARAGLEPVTAARLAGRSLSVLGLLATLAAAYRLARLDGAPRRAGWWAVLLIASAPVLSGQPYAVRPDMVGVALQTFGVLRVLAALRSDRPRGTALLWAYATFALAVCVKQHFLAVPTVSTVLLLGAWWRGLVAWKEIERGLLLAVAIVAAVYGLEGMATGGRVWQAAIVAAESVGRVHPGGWNHVYLVCVGIMNRTAGLIALLAAAGLTTVGARSGVGRKIVAVVGTGVIGLIVAALVLHSIVYRAEPGALAVVAAFGALVVVFPICALIDRASLLGNRLDAVLWAYGAGEVALSMALFRVSTGTWSNYAIQFVVFAGILTARAASCAVGASSSPWVLLPAALATVGVMASASNDLFDVTREIRAERAAVALIFEHLKRPHSEFFFTDRPGFNRIHGRLDLVYDDWLYPVFESLRLAEPRSRWLRAELTSGPVRAIVNSSDAPRIAGIEQSLRALGYRPDVHVGRFYVWTR